MSGIWLQVGLVVLLVAINAVFAGSELALVSLREGQLRRLERVSATGRLVVALARDPNRFLATIQIGITLAGFLASATAAVTLAEPLVPVLDFLGAAAKPVAIVIITVILTFLTLVFGELAPKRVAMQHAERWALVVARPLTVLAMITRPAVWILSKTSDLAVRVMGGDPHRQREEITPAEIRDLVAAHQGFTPEQQLIIAGAVEITERVLREVMVPRRDAYTIEAGTRCDEARAQLGASGHSRAPVVRHGNLDDVVGVVHLRDLIAADGATVGDLARPAYLLPDSLHVATALRRFKADREQFALVVDEHGAVDGIVTLEDLVEEVVGEIYDETDRDVASVERQPDGSLLLPGAFPLHDLHDVGIEIHRRPDGDFTTIAGLIIAALGRLPSRPGEQVTLDGWIAEVTAIEGRAVTRVRMRPSRQPDPGEAAPRQEPDTHR